MKNIVLFLLLLASCFNVQAQMFLKIISKPEYYNPIFDTIHIPGAHNNWDPAVPSDQVAPDIYKIPAFTGSTEYKITRGSWAAVEAAINGTDIPNRSLTYVLNDTVEIEVKQWKDFYSSTPHSVTPEVNVLKSDFIMPKLNKKRRVWIHLPKDYGESGISYPVMYMHDGQNLFDRPYSFLGEWKVDETLANDLPSGFRDCIVIGIDNGGADRIDEYTPYRHPNYGGGKGELYTDFLINTLKPFVDNHFRTLPQPEHTGLSGSSLGGLVSFYAGIKHPEVFGKLGIFSPSFWYSDSLYMDVDDLTPDPAQKIYIVAGQNEDVDMVPDIDIYINKLKSRGVKESNIKRVIHSDGAHSEWYWAREFSAAYQWLDLWNSGTSKTIDKTTSEKYLRIKENPSIQPTFNLSKSISGNKKVEFHDVNGKLIHSFKPVGQESFVFDSTFKPGVYFATLTFANHKESLKFVKI